MAHGSGACFERSKPFGLPGRHTSLGRVRIYAGCMKLGRSQWLLVGCLLAAAAAVARIARHTPLVYRAPIPQGTVLTDASLAAQGHRGESGDVMTIASSGPIVLGEGPAQAVLTGKSLAARAEALAPGRRIYLVLRELRASEPPGVLYHVYLDLPAGATPAKDDIHFAGTLNFYDAVPLQGEAGASSKFRSFDVTDLVKTLQRRKALSDPTTVTIIPSGIPASGAQASVGKVEIVEQ